MILKKCIILSIYITLILASISCKNPNDRTQQKEQSLRENIGEHFRLNNLIDSTGKKIELDFSKSERTIIDFWFNTCPPCITDMAEFPNLLKGKEEKITIISISVNAYPVWKATLSAPSGKFAFLNNNSTNWKHYALQSTQDESLGNPLSLDRIQEIQKTYHVTYFPSYFVVDKNGIILERSKSASEYINELN